MQTRTMAAMCAAVLAGIFLAAGQTAVAAITIETVRVGNAGNAADTAAHSGNSAGQGSVSYEYNIGTYEVTAGQYCAFLNAVAKTDTYGLYNVGMAPDSYGCQITRLGTSGSYTYDFSGRPSGTEADWANRPVNYVSWGDSVRFANWLTNGQGNGDTETGAYNLNGAMTEAQLMAVAVPSADQRAAWSTGAKSYFLLTSEDEWYKAAYHNPATSSYYDYPTSSNTAPGQDMADASGNNANYFTDLSTYPIDSGKYTTLAGEFQNSDSPYGTFDQGGNVSEWNEAILYESTRGERGGSFNFNHRYDLLASNRSGGYDPTNEGSFLGFRVSEVPEPCSAALLLIGTLGVVRRRRKA